MGFRHIRAARYRAGGGASTAVDIGAASTLISSMPFLSSVTNPLAAKRWRGSRISVAGLASRAAGDSCSRSRCHHRRLRVARPAVPGCSDRTRSRHFRNARVIPGSAIAGVVGVFVVPPDRHEGPPTPDQEQSRAVAVFEPRVSSRGRRSRRRFAPLSQDSRREDSCRNLTRTPVKRCVA